MDDDKKAVPKFGSFTGRKPVPKCPTQPFEARPKVAEGEDNKNEVTKNHRNRQREHRSLSRQSKNNHTATTVVKSGPEPNSIVRDRDLGFVVDTKGDIDNVKYGTASRWKIPKYTRAGSRRVLGTLLRLDGSHVTDAGITLSPPGEGAHATRQILGRKHLRFPQAQRLKSQSEPDAALQLGEDVVALADSHIESQLQVDLLDQVREISPNLQDVADHSDVISDSEAIDILSQRAVFEKNAELGRAVRTGPGSVNDWLALADFQSKLILPFDSSSRSNGISPSQKKKLADIRIAIYKDGLKQSIAGSPDRYRLWLELLLASRTSNDWETQSRTWQQAVEDCPNSKEIRLAKLDFVQRNYLHYGHELCKQEYLGMLSLLKTQHEATEEPSERENIIQLQIYIVLRYTIFFQQSGYHELAFAIWQAALDYCLFQPSRLGHTVETYGEFWDSEAARLGEGSSGGWATYAPGDPTFDEAPGLHVDAPEPASAPMEGLPVASVALLEKRLVEKSSLPGRIAQMDDAADAFHVVMSSDISPVLERLIVCTSYRQPLAFAFVCFAGIPLLDSAPEACLEWYRDPWIVKPTVQMYSAVEFTSPCRWIWSNGFTKELVSIIVCKDDTTMSNANLRHNDIVIRILRRSLDVLSSPTMQMLLVVATLKWKGISAAAKETKRLLRADSTNIPLYQVLFALENYRGNAELAEKMISTPIQMRQSFSTSIQDNIIQLWRNWIWYHFVQNNTGEAEKLLLSLTASAFNHQNLEQAQWQASSVLKSRQYIEGALNQALHQQNAENIVSALEIGMLLTYFESSRSLAAAIQYFRTNLARLSVAHPRFAKMMELLHQGRTDIVKYHAKHVRPYRPSDVQSLLQESMQLFPDNGAFLEQYANQQLTFSLDDRLRGAIMMATHAEHDSLPKWLTLISLEHRRWESISASQHSTRAIFERAVASASGDMSLALWLSYLKFEQSYGTIGQFESVLRRALTKLPWVKEIVLEGLIHLDGKIAHDKLRQLYNLLEERDIRMMTSIQ